MRTYVTVYLVAAEAELRDLHNLRIKAISSML